MIAGNTYLCKSNVSLKPMIVNNNTTIFQNKLKSISDMMNYNVGNACEKLLWLFFSNLTIEYLDFSSVVF